MKAITANAQNGTTVQKILPDIGLLSRTVQWRLGTGLIHQDPIEPARGHQNKKSPGVTGCDPTPQDATHLQGLANLPRKATATLLKDRRLDDTREDTMAPD